MVHFRQYLTLDWRDFPENSNLGHVIGISQNSKGTVLEEYSTFLLCLSLHLRNILGNRRMAH